MFPLNLTRKAFLLLSGILIPFIYSSAQPQSNNWFFGSYNGLNFGSGTPVNIPDSRLFTMEGGSSISDKNGQLLFYTDGARVYNRLHQLVAGDLHGEYVSAAQSCVIVPKTHDEKEYYIFTVDEEAGPHGLQYSVMDMTLNGGMGGITTKNIPLVPRTCEKVTAVLHCNKKDFWIITHKYKSSEFYAYLATATGVDPIPVISSTGSFVKQGYATMAGQLKSSPDGKKLVAGHGLTGADLCDFDTQTGVVSNAVEIFGNANSVPYGVEFSSNSGILYLAVSQYWDYIGIRRLSGLFQYDMTRPTIQDIILSKKQLFQYFDNDEIGSLQRGPDGKIYMAQYRKPYLSVVNKPEIYGEGCDFVNIGVVLPNQGQFNLPNHINDYGEIDSYAPAETGGCLNEPVIFNYRVPTNTTHVSWHFGDPASGAADSSHELSPEHVFRAEGVYKIELIAYGLCKTDTIRGKAIIGKVEANLGLDRTFCEGSSVRLSTLADPGNHRFLWQDGNTNPGFNASSEGIYWVQVTHLTNGCTRRDSVVLKQIVLPVVRLGNDTTICIGTVITIDAQNPGSSYKWDDESQLPVRKVGATGWYYVDVTKDGCSSRDSIQIQIVSKPEFDLGPDQPLCPDNPLILNPGLKNVDYIWQDGSVESMFRVHQVGTYKVLGSNKCGIVMDSIHVYNGICNIHIPNTFTPNNDGKNEVFQVLGDERLFDFSLSVYNRWGECLFSTNNKNMGWNGTFKGKNCPAGSYTYFLQCRRSVNEPLQQRKGVLLLLR